MFGIKKSSFPLTDEEVIRTALKTVTEYAKWHPGGTFNTGKCLDQVMNSVKIIWRKARRYAPNQALKPKDLEELMVIYSRIENDLRRRAEIKITECLKSRSIQQINISTATALLEKELRQRGFKFFFKCQKFRVKASVQIASNSAMTFIVKYKDIQEGKLPDIVNHVMAVIDALNNSNANITVWTLSGSRKNWNRWQK